MDDEHEYASGGGYRLRLFTTLHLASAAAQRLGAHARYIAQSYDGVRALDADDLHVTFAWLGEVAEEYVPAIALALDTAAGAVPGATGCHVAGSASLAGDSVHAAVVDVELIAALNAARDGFVDAAKPFASAVDRRPWVPHVSLVRSIGRGVLPPELRAAPPELPPVAWVARELTLVASLPAPGGGHHYRTLHRTLLGGTPELADTVLASLHG